MRALRVGMIGCGHISAAHLRGWKKAKSARASSVFDVHGSTAAAVAHRFGIEHVSASVEELIDRSDVIDICTPPGSHARLLRQALSSGRHVLIEKPVVTDSADWDEIEGLLERRDSRLAVVHHLKFTQCVRRAKSWIDGGLIGRPLRLDWRFLTSPRFDRMLTADEHWSHTLPGGRWLETLPHNLYLIHHLVGPMKVGSVSVLSTPEAPAGAAADEVMVSLKGSDCLATVHFSAHCELNVRSGTIVGTQGIIRVDLLSNLATLERRGDSRVRRAFGISMLEAGSRFLQSLAQRPAVALQRLRGHTPHTNLIRSFAQHLQSTGPPPTPIEEIDFVVRSCSEIGHRIDNELE